MGVIRKITTGRLVCWLTSALVTASLLAGLGCRTTEKGRSPSGWQGVLSSQPLPLTILQPEHLPTNAPLPVVFYLRNLAAPRVGSEKDTSILRDLRASGYLVAVLDYSGRTNARMPHLNRDLARLRDDLRAKKLLGDVNADMTRVFILPAGCRLQRDLVFFREESRTLAMDIVYPSGPRRPVGSVIEFSCDNKDRFGNASLSVCGDTLLDGLATEGFAVAMADHPVAPPYKGIDPMPESARKIKAAVRTLRAQAGNLGLNGRIVPVGFSRGSGMALMLATTGGMPEFESYGEHPDTSSQVEGAVVMSGRFTYLDLLPDDKMLPRYAIAWGERETSHDVWRRHGALDYLTKPTVPLFLTINCAESPDALHQMKVLRKRLANLGSDEVFFMDREPRGHKVTLDPTILEGMVSYLKSRLQPGIAQ